MAAKCKEMKASTFTLCLYFVSSFTVREVDAGVSPAISIHHLGNVGATKSERAGISKLKSDMKMVRSRGWNVKAQRTRYTRLYCLNTLLETRLKVNFKKKC